MSIQSEARLAAAEALLREATDALKRGYAFYEEVPNEIRHDRTWDVMLEASMKIDAFLAAPAPPANGGKQL